MAKKSPSDILKLAMTLSILAALPISVMAFNTFRYGFPQARPSSILPSSQHYSLELIGVPQDSEVDITLDAGNKIFIPLVGRTVIALYEGDFAVTDVNATDARAEISLPNSSPDADGATDYFIWVKALSKIDGNLNAFPCATDNLTGDIYCSTMQMVTVSEREKNSFVDVTRDLTYVYADINRDGRTARHWLFSDAMQGYLWNYDELGLKRVQIRIYELPSPSAN